MSDIWLISDTHFQHANLLNFLGEDGIPFRGQRFSSVKEMDELMIHNWNEVIKPSDKVYHLGDVMFGSKEKFELLWPRLMGHKRLILGNHDDGHYMASNNFFEKIMVWRLFKGYDMILTHVPMQLSNTYEGARQATFNVHGHIHQNTPPTVRHINICVEQTDYKPVNIEDLAVQLRKRKATL